MGNGKVIMKDGFGQV